ncbi:hypothetical protein [Novosphingobium sp. ST904]|uniref:hypothetical protein n=1 Tax=Novosphingobium sp. ST904 TaxID=1684385 RepID=UPI000AAF6FC3|nr:hypothetical protein [Novosphingobium sp. ST904]
MPARSMACLLCAGLAAVWWPGSAAAQETTTAQDTAAAPAPELASTDATSQAASADPADTAPPQPVDPWTITLSAGLSNRDDGPDGSWQTLSLTRQIGRGYVRGGVMRYHGTLIQADTALPSDYYVGTLGAGGNFDNWVIDGWASYGRQVYGKISTDWGSRQSSGARSSAYYALGGDFGRIFPLSPRWFVTPTIVVPTHRDACSAPPPPGPAWSIWKPGNQHGRWAALSASIMRSAKMATIMPASRFPVTGPATPYRKSKSASSRASKRFPAAGCWIRATIQTGGGRWASAPT